VDDDVSSLRSARPLRSISCH